MHTTQRHDATICAVGVLTLQKQPRLIEICCCYAHHGLRLVTMHSTHFLMDSCQCHVRLSATKLTSFARRFVDANDIRDGWSGITNYGIGVADRPREIMTFKDCVTASGLQP